MKDKTTATQPTDTSIQRKTYQTPVLHRFGAVRDLTQGTGTGAENRQLTGLT